MLKFFSFKPTVDAFSRLCLARNYSSPLKSCWNCEKQLNAGEFFCSCGKIQRIDKNQSYFQVLDISEHEHVHLNKSQLSEKMKSLQKQLHPDRFVKSSNMEKQLSETASSIVNEAYRVIQNDIDRYSYLLKQLGFDLDEKNSLVQDMEFLNEMLNFNETLDHIKSLSRTENSSDVQKESQDTIFQFTSNVDQMFLSEKALLETELLAKNYAKAHVTLGRLKFLDRMKKDFKEISVDLKTKGLIA